MTLRRTRSGTTLVELLVALAVLGILAGLAWPPLRRLADAYAVRAARDALAAGVARTRAAAVGRGGATLVVDVAASRFWIEGVAGDTLDGPIELAAEHRVGLEAAGASGGAVRLPFDGLGLGRLANRTFRVVRGGAEAGLTVSSYGRVRLW